MQLPIKGKFILAPMAGNSDSVFREQCEQAGAALTVSELTSVEGIVRKEDELFDVLDVVPGKKCSVQLFGSNVENIIKAAKIVEPYASVIDFNMGCPAPHITALECGAALLMKPEKIREIFTALVAAVSVPVTAKLRAGTTEKHLPYLEIAKILEECGVAMITLHPRTLKQGYSGKADWSRIKALKEAVSVPVCGNGDVTSPEDAKKMLDETGCDYVMIGRGALGKPGLFRQCVDYVETGKYSEITQEEQMRAWEAYVDEAEKRGVKFSRLKGQAQNFTRGLDGARRLREKIIPARSIGELKSAMREKKNLKP